MKLRTTAIQAAIWSALVPATSLVSVVAIAQEAQNDQHETMVVQAKSFEDYKVDDASGAMRSNTRLLETPQSVNVIPEIVMDEQLATKLGQVLSNDASVSAGSRKWNREVFSLRGFELASGNGYLRNGHAQFAHYMLPIETLERVEVLKGPSSLLYGTASPGGVINMVTKRPTYTPQVNVGTDVDDLGSTRMHIDASGPLNQAGSVRGRVVMVKQDTNEQRKYATGDQRERDRYLGYGVVEADLSDWGMLSVHYERTQDEANIDAGAWLDASGNVVGDRDLIRDMPWAYTDNNVENIGFDLDLYLTGNWQAKMGYNHQNFDRRRFDSSPRTTENSAVDGRYEIRPFERMDDWKHKT